MNQVSTTPIPITLPTPTQTATSYFGLFTSTDPIVPILFNVGKAILILLIALVLAGFAKRWAVRLLSRGKRNNLGAASLVGNLVQITIVVLGLINMLVALGVDLASLVTVLGVTGLAISLSLQDLMRNVVAGIYILIEQPFRIKDRITVKDSTGTVEAIELRTTILRTDDGLQVVVPNNVVLNEIVTNRSINNAQKGSVRVRIKPQDPGDLQKMADEITGMLAGIDLVARDPAPGVLIEGMHTGTARLKVEFWFPTGKKGAASSRVIDALRERWPDANMAVAE